MCLDDFYVPEFLNTKEKWNDCVRNTDNLDKFEQVMRKLLEDEKITAWDFYTLMCALSNDLEEEHKNKSFSALLQLVESLINYFYYQMGLNKH